MRLAVLLLVLCVTAGCGTAGLVTSTAPANLSAACSHTPLPNGLLITRLGASAQAWRVRGSRVFTARTTVCNLAPLVTASGNPSQGLRYRIQFLHNGQATFFVTADATGKRTLFYRTDTGTAYRTTSQFWSLMAKATGMTVPALFSGG